MALFFGFPKTTALSVILWLLERPPLVKYLSERINLSRVPLGVETRGQLVLCEDVGLHFRRSLARW